MTALSRWTTRRSAASLVFANAYGSVKSVPELSGFFANVKSTRGLRLECVNGWTKPDDRDEERTVLEDVANGAADLAWVGARAVGAVLGIRSLEALHAPLLFPDETAVSRFLSSAPVEPLLTPLREAGLVGLALLPGGLRRPLGITAPLVSPDDWRGKVIRTHASLTGEAALRALGATPVLRSNAELSAGPPSGIDGVDLHTEALAGRGYSGWLTWNLPLWPRLVLLVANGARLERLSTEERTLLEGAGREAQRQHVPSQRADIPAGVELVEASQDDLTRLREQLRPVYEEIRSTAEGERTLAQIERRLAGEPAGVSP
ncbi:MAG: TRAP-type transport system periplasmic protein [Gaiellaceae bacterium]|jgi:TRAP-type C4-dicarboxylate transport system substrate-binding protein|nr:TRAP-type transport system periplasmic protein [Gaiellaceae bacterium]